MEAEACAPLVDSLLARLPALGAAALLAALEAEAAEPYRRLVARAHLTLGEAALDALLARGDGALAACKTLKDRLAQMRTRRRAITDVARRDALRAGEEGA